MFLRKTVSDHHKVLLGSSVKIMVYRCEDDSFLVSGSGIIVVLSSLRKAASKSYGVYDHVSAKRYHLCIVVSAKRHLCCTVSSVCMVTSTQSGTIVSKVNSPQSGIIVARCLW
jgi:hypothetical protein